MNGLIICAGNITKYEFLKKYLIEADFLVCADGGAGHFREFQTIPHVLLGDFDSVFSDDFEYFKGLGVEIIKFDREKDATDSELAVDIAIERGCTKITVLGGIGTRLDHSLANVMLLRKMSDRGVFGRIVDEYNEIMLVSDEMNSIKINNDGGCRLSLIPFDNEVLEVSTKGLYYELCRDVLKAGSTRGVSNEFVGDEAEVSVGKGFMFIIKSKD